MLFKTRTALSAMRQFFQGRLLILLGRVEMFLYFDKPGGVYNLVLVENFIVDMGAGASAAVTYKAYDLTFFYRITLLHQTFFKVGVLGYKAVAMVKHDVSSADPVILLGNDNTVRSCP